MTVATLERAIPPGSRILLDSTTLVAYLNGGEVVSPAAVHVIDTLVRPGRNSALISMVAVLEVLVRPLQHGATGYMHAVDFLTRFPNFVLQPIDMVVAQEAAGIRANHGLASPDALIVASGVVAGVQLIVCNDVRWKSISDTRVKVVVLRDHVPL